MTIAEEPHRRSLSDGELVGAAAMVWLAALAAVAAPVWPVGIATAVAWFARRRVIFVIALVILATGLGHRAVDDFRPRAPARFSGEVVVLAEAKRLGSGWLAVVRLPDGDRVEALGFGSSGIELRRAGAGSALDLSGQLRPTYDTGWSRSRHLVGRLAVSDVRDRRGPTGLRAGVESIRGWIVAGAEPLEPDLQPLYLGLVIGEDRMQGPAQRARFRAAGLSHLLAVSGQNVAFVLAVTAPVSRLFGRRGRLVFIVGLLVVFAIVTRFEPSVLRATMTAGLATASSLSGHERDGLRLLSLAIIALVLIDPFLVHAVGFQLSVAASTGILLLAPSLMARFRGPTLVRQAVSVTMAAQLAVLPLQLFYFGPVSAAAIPANVLAGWAAGSVMAWGLTAGVVAGSAPGPVGDWIQMPAGWMLQWLDAVATVAARSPAPRMTGPVAGIVAALLVLRWLGSGPALATRVGGRILTASAVGGLLALLLVAGPKSPSAPTSLPGGGWWFPGDDLRPSVLVVSADANGRLTDELAARGLFGVDLIVSSAGSGPGAMVTAAVAELVDHRAVLAPAQHRIVGAYRVTAPLVLETAGGQLNVDPAGNRLVVTPELRLAAP